jgi:hypothetical protein
MEEPIISRSVYGAAGRGVVKDVVTAATPGLDPMHASDPNKIRTL